MVWGCRLLFDLDAEDRVIERIVTWLEARAVPHSLFIAYANDGLPGRLTLLLPDAHYTDAVYLSLWPCCRSVARLA